MLFSDFLGAAGKRVRVLDCDKQESIYRKYLEDLTCEGIPFDASRIQDPDFVIPYNPNSLFNIERLEFNMLSDAIQGLLAQGVTTFSDEENDVNVFDMPGQLNIEQMEPIFRLADAIITPSNFGDFDDASTLTFAEAIDSMRLRAKKFIIPNNINASANYSNRKQIEQKLLSLGYSITPEVTRTVNLQRNLSTMFINPVVYAVVESAFIYVINKLNLR